MTHWRRASSEDVELVLAGCVPPGRGDLAAVAAFCADLERTYVGDPVVAASRATVQGTTRPARRVEGTIGTAMRRLGVGLGATALLLGGAGAANALPASLQRAVSNVAQEVGVSMPTPDEVSGDTGGNRPGTSHGAPPSSTRHEPGSERIETEAGTAPHRGVTVPSTSGATTVAPPATAPASERESEEHSGPSSPTTPGDDANEGPSTDERHEGDEEDDDASRGSSDDEPEAEEVDEADDDADADNDSGPGSDDDSQGDG